MSDQHEPAKDRSTELAEERTDLARTRTVIAAERTLMAWIRTAVSLIGFGFTIYKFFQYLRESEKTLVIARPQAPRNLALTLIAIGTLALIGAAIEHRAFLNRMGAEVGRHLWSLAFVVALMMALLGVVTFLSILYRTGPF